MANRAPAEESVTIVPLSFIYGDIWPSLREVFGVPYVQITIGKTWLPHFRNYVRAHGTLHMPAKWFFTDHFILTM